MPFILSMHPDLHARAQQALDNNDFCSACGGSGYLLCCDGCDRSFHFTCLDPPFNQSEHYESRWFCAACEAKRGSSRGPVDGLFAPLNVVLEQSNPTAFRLPEYVQRFFEGTSAGPDGEYIEGPEQRSL